MKITLAARYRLAAGALAAGFATMGTLRAGANPIAIENPTFSEFHSVFAPTDPAKYNKPDNWVASGGNPILVAVNTTNYYAKGGTESGTTALMPYGQYGGGPNVVTASHDTGYKIKLGDTLTLKVAVADPLYGTKTNAPLLQQGNFAITINGTIVAKNTTLSEPMFGTDNGGNIFGNADPHFRTYIDGIATYTLTPAEAYAHPITSMAPSAWSCSRPRNRCISTTTCGLKWGQADSRARARIVMNPFVFSPISNSARSAAYPDDRRPCLGQSAGYGWTCDHLAIDGQNFVRTEPIVSVCSLQVL